MTNFLKSFLQTGQVASLQVAGKFRAPANVPRKLTKAQKLTKGQILAIAYKNKLALLNQNNSTSSEIAVNDDYTGYYDIRISVKSNAYIEPGDNTIYVSVSDVDTGAEPFRGWAYMFNTNPVVITTPTLNIGNNYNINLYNINQSYNGIMQVLENGVDVTTTWAFAESDYYFYKSFAAGTAVPQIEIVFLNAESCTGNTDNSDSRDDSDNTNPDNTDSVDNGYGYANYYDSSGIGNQYLDLYYFFITLEADFNAYPGLEMFISNITSPLTLSEQSPSAVGCTESAPQTVYLADAAYGVIFAHDVINNDFRVLENYSDGNGYIDNTADWYAVDSRIQKTFYNYVPNIKIVVDNAGNNYCNYYYGGGDGIGAQYLDISDSYDNYCNSYYYGGSDGIGAQYLDISGSYDNYYNSYYYGGSDGIGVQYLNTYDALFSLGNQGYTATAPSYYVDGSIEGDVAIGMPLISQFNITQNYNIELILYNAAIVNDAAQCVIHENGADATSTWQRLNVITFIKSFSAGTYVPNINVVFEYVSQLTITSTNTTTARVSPYYPFGWVFTTTPPTAGVDIGNSFTNAFGFPVSDQINLRFDGAQQDISFSSQPSVCIAFMIEGDGHTFSENGVDTTADWQYVTYTMFDPTGKFWYKQFAAGPIPEIVINF